MLPDLFLPCCLSEMFVGGRLQSFQTFMHRLVIERSRPAGDIGCQGSRIILLHGKQRYGNLLGQLGAFALRQFFPVFPAYPPDWAVIAGLSTALATGLLFGVMPARRAARLDPVQALMKH